MAARMVHLSRAVGGRRGRRGGGRRGGRRPPGGPGRPGCGRRRSERSSPGGPGLVACAAWGGTSRSGASPNGRAAHYAGHERRFLRLAMACQTKGADMVKPIASIAFGSCTSPRLATTTTAAVHEARCTAAIHAALAGKGLVPAEHLVDAGYVDAELLVRSREDHGIDLVGPPRVNASWQAKAEGAYTIERFGVDWDAERVRCPQGKLSSAWSSQVDHAGMPYVSVMFRKADCGACPARSLCTRAKHRARHLKLQPRAEYEALKAARGRLATREGRRRYARRAGIEGTISQGVRAFGLRRSRYRGLARTHLQHVATAAAINLARLGDWFQALPRAATRISRFAALAA